MMWAGDLYSASVMPITGFLFARLDAHPADRIFIGKKTKPQWTPWERKLLEIAADLGCRYRIVDFEGDPYLLRIYLHGRPKKVASRFDRLRRKLPGINLHCFLRSDSDRELHSHPWEWSVSVILVGGYTEERRVGNVVRARRRRPFPFPSCINLLRSTDYHRVELNRRGGVEERCWTLFITGPRIQHWGFWDRNTGRIRPAEDERVGEAFP